MFISTNAGLIIFFDDYNLENEKKGHACLLVFALNYYYFLLIRA